MATRDLQNVTKTEEEFVRLVEGEKGRSLKYASTYTRNFEDAKDAYQEAVLKAWKGFDSYDRERPFPRWFRTILQRHLIDRSRVKKNTNEIPCAPDILSELVGTCDLAAPKEMSEEMILALMELRPDQRRIVQLHVIEGFGLDDCSNTMNLSPKKAAALLKEALLVMKDALS